MTDNSKTTGFQLVGPGVSKADEPSKGTGRSTWTVTLKKGKYVYSSITHIEAEADASGSRSPPRHR